MGLVQFDEATFRGCYNRAPFVVRHNLADHPLMQLPALTALALRMDPKNVIHRVGLVPVNTDFDRVHLHHPLKDSLQTAISNIGQAGVAITINMPERDAEYRGVIDEILDDIRAHSDAIDPGLNWHAAYVFISAPGSLTPYHMDREMNFLLQVRGLKTVQLWDPHDPDVMSEEEVDRLFGTFTRPQYKEAAVEKAMVYELEPGLGVHHPFIAPHLVRTRDNVSISLAVTFRTRGSDRVSALHRINHHLRRVGVHPTPVGTSPGRDSVKWMAFRPALAVAGLARRTSAEM